MFGLKLQGLSDILIFSTFFQYSLGDMVNLEGLIILVHIELVLLIKEEFDNNNILNIVHECIEDHFVIVVEDFICKRN